jgi:hypothetical protein
LTSCSAFWCWVSWVSGCCAEFCELELLCAEPPEGAGTEVVPVAGAGGFCAGADWGSTVRGSGRANSICGDGASGISARDGLAAVSGGLAGTKPCAQRQEVTPRKAIPKKNRTTSRRTPETIQPPILRVGSRSARLALEQIGVGDTADH